MSSRTRHGIDWNQAKLLKFISLLEKHPCLWNDTLPEYRSYSAQNLALKKIAKNMNLGKRVRYELLHKISQIQAVYAAELKMIALYESVGAQYTPTLYWFNAVDRFLRRFMEGDRPDPAVTDEVKFNYQRLLIDENSDDEIDTEVDENTGLEPIDNETGEALSPSPSAGSRASPEPSKDDKLGLLTSIMQEIKESVESESAGDISGDFEVFGQSVAAQLAALPAEDALQLQADIQLLITNKRLQGMKDTHHSNVTQ